MSLLAAFMVAHPVLAIKEIGKEKADHLATSIASFELIAKQIAAIQPDTIVWISPHAENYADFFQIADGEIGLGSLKRFGAPGISFRMLYDRQMVEEITNQCQAMGISGGSEDSSEDNIDHGTMVPLYFINKEYRDFLSVRVGISGFSLAEHYRFGQAIRKAIDKTGKKVVVVASGDLSHCLSRNGKQGYRPEGVQYDEQMMRIMGKANFCELLSFNRHLLDEAMECCHRSFTIMAGILDRLDLESIRYSHEAPFGVGYGFCQYRVLRENHSRAFLDIYETRERFIAKQKVENADVYVRLARQAIETYVASHRVIAISPNLPSSLTKEKAGVFVTIHKDGELRGCIGTIKPFKASLAEEIITNAIAAACKDKRFESIKPKDLAGIVVSVDVISSLIPILSPSDLDPKVYGVMVDAGYSHAVLLPNLPGIDTPEKQIEVCRRKMGISSDEMVELYRFDVDHHE